MSVPEIIIINGKISHVGTDDAVRATAGRGTRVIDAAGGTVMPGFIDSHVHLFGGSVELSCLDLHGVQGLGALNSAVAPYAARQAGICSAGRLRDPSR